MSSVDKTASGRTSQTINVFIRHLYSYTGTIIIIGRYYLSFTNHGNAGGGVAFIGFSNTDYIVGSASGGKSGTIDSSNVVSALTKTESNKSGQLLAAISCSGDGTATAIMKLNMITVFS